MFTLGGYLTATIAFRYHIYFIWEILRPKLNKLAKLSYNYGPRWVKITKSAFVNKIFNLNT